MNKASERPSLNDAWTKLDWARKHFEVLRPEVEAFEQRDAHRFDVEIDADAAKYVFYIRDLDQPPSDWGLRLGDCLHNARIALDYLLVRLVALTTGQNPRDIKAVSFPVYTDPGDFASRVGSLRKQSSFSGYLTRIEELQPFNVRNHSIWGMNPTPSPLPAALQRLADLDDLDKHRVIHAAWLGASWPAAAFPEVAPPEFKFVTGALTTGGLRNDTEIATWWFEKPLPFEWNPTQVEMKRQFPIEVAINQPMPFQRVGDIVPFCLWGVEAVLTLFEPVFSHGAPPLPVTQVPEPPEAPDFSWPAAATR